MYVAVSGRRILQTTRANFSQTSLFRQKISNVNSMQLYTSDRQSDSECLQEKCECITFGSYYVFFRYLCTAQLRAAVHHFRCQHCDVSVQHWF